MLERQGSSPALMRACTTGALSAGMCLKASQAALVGRLATSMLSLTPNGTPYRGPLAFTARLSNVLQGSLKCQDLCCTAYIMSCSVQFLAGGFVALVSIFLIRASDQQYMRPQALLSCAFWNSSIFSF